MKLKFRSQCYVLNKKLYRKLLLVWRCKTSRVNYVKVRAYVTPKMIHHWHGTNHGRAPSQSIANEAQSLKCIHAHNKQMVHTNITHIESQGDMFTHIIFIMNFQFNIILCM